MEQDIGGGATASRPFGGLGVDTILAGLVLFAGAVLFLSDVLAELDAAHGAGMAVRLVVRQGNAPVAAHQYDVVHGLDEVMIHAKR